LKGVILPAIWNRFHEYPQRSQPLGTISAASVIITVPLVILVLVCQKRIVSGMTAGAVKG
jgi:ABC-type maltose transport system permease subunit